MFTAESVELERACHAVEVVDLGRGVIDLALGADRDRSSGAGTSSMSPGAVVFSWVTDEDVTFLTRNSDGVQHWWTFAGTVANTWLSVGLGDLTDQATPRALSIRLTGKVRVSELSERLSIIHPEDLTLSEQVASGAVERLKFADALPDALARRVVEERMRADSVVRAVAQRGVRAVTPYEDPAVGG